MPSSKRQEGIYQPSISGRTKVLGVFGYPVEHSLSPAMHNAAIAALGLHYVYIPFSVLPDDVGPAIRSLPALGIIGVNLTIPHKERVLPFLDAIAPEAEAVGAVNTVHDDGGRLIGYNTDGEGFSRPLKAQGFDLCGKRAVVLGAGGAARSVVYRLAREGAQTVLVNRTPARAMRLADEVNRAAGGAVVEWLALEDVAGLKSALAGAELLVNATSAGMYPHVGERPPIPPNSLHPGLLVYDLVYNPAETRLLAEARAAGARVLNGLPMLVHQGAAAFQIWTGIAPPVEVMERAVRDHLTAVGNVEKS
jgi:shikimate dehydrogenase